MQSVQRDDEPGSAAARSSHPLVLELGGGVRVDLDAVATLLEETATRLVMPRFRCLAASEVMEKRPGDPVTIADLECERALAAAFGQILPTATFIGEEACAADPTLAARAGEPGLAVAIDPIDGTLNFAAGIPCFAVMAVLFCDGRAVASWIHDPIGRRTALAGRGLGAWMGRRRLRVRPLASPAMAATMASVWVPPELLGRHTPLLARLAPRLAACGSTAALRCAGRELLCVAEGDFTGYLALWASPWDTFPGALLVEEAGGIAVRGDGRPLDPTDRATPVVIAATPAEAARLCGLLIPGLAPEGVLSGGGVLGFTPSDPS